MRVSRSWPWLAVLLGGWVVAGPVVRTQTSDEASIKLEAVIQQQRLTGDTAAAVVQYEGILAKYGAQRRVAAQVLWRLAQGQEQLGRFEQARQTYERLIREHADQPTLTAAAGARLTSLIEDEDWLDRELSQQVVIDTTRDPVTTSRYGSGTPNQRFTIFSDLAVFDRAEQVTRRLQTGARSAAYPVLSPNNQLVAYLGWNDDLQDNAARLEAGYSPMRAVAGPELRMIRINGTDDRALVRSDNLRWLRPYAWSPDGTSILALFERTSGVRQIALVGTNGSVRVLKSLPWLSAQEMTFSPDGLYVAYQAATPPSSRQLDLFVLPVGAPTAPVAERRFTLAMAAQRGARVTDAELATHVLNRLGFGPRAGDVQRVRAMGIDAYIAQQLAPESLADPVVNAKTAKMSSLEMTIPELLEKGGPAVAIANRRRMTIFQRPEMLSRQQAQAAGEPNPGALAGTDPMLPRGADFPHKTEIVALRMFRAVHSTRQLNEVLVDFWMNHFNVNMDDEQLVSHFEEQAIRRHVFGRFEDMLVAVSKHPRMLFYLDNWRSSAPAEVIDGRVAALMKTADVDGKVALLERQPFLKDSKGLNENFARELLELHTVGVDGGYTQADILAVARILTGWTITTRGLVNGIEENGAFGFDPLMHVDGDKVVMGRTFKGGGVDEGEQLLKMLAHHPSTAKFIATKLARRFIADDPPTAVIESASRTFLRTGGDLREVVRTILMSPEFRSSEYLRVKIKKPFELVASALRAVDATLEDFDRYGALVTGNQALISRMGEKMYNHEAPDGNPDVGPAWMNSNALLLRLDFANRLATGTLDGIKANLTTAQAVLTELGVPRPSPLQVEQTRAMLQTAAAARADAGGGMQMMARGQGAAGAAAQIDPNAVVVAAMLGSPQFQKR